MTKHDVPLWMTLAHAGKVTGESRQTLWRRTKDGSLKATKHGRTLMVSRDSLFAYMNVDPEYAESSTTNDGALGMTGFIKAVPDEAT